MQSVDAINTTLTTLEQAQAAELVGKPAFDSLSRNELRTELFLASSDFHGIDALLHYQLRQNRRFDQLSESIRQALSRSAHAQAALVMLLEAELRCVLSALAEINIQPLLLKGTPLSHTHYPHPALRTRSDNDLLILPEQKAAATTLLEQQGYERLNTASGEILIPQFCYSKRDSIGATHTIDLHWKINNSAMFINTFSYAELRQDAIPVPQLGDNADGLCPVHALFLACLHRAGHLSQRQEVGGETRLIGNRLIWLYDIHLLVQALTETEQARFIELAIAKQLQVVCLDAFKHCQHLFDSAIPKGILAALTAAANNSDAIQITTSGWRKHIAQYRALPNWRQRLQLVREQILPPASYMRIKYGIKHDSLLPAYYLHRAITGAWRQLR